MKVHVFTQSIKVGGEGVGVGFRVVAEALPLTQVSLSRVVGKCLFNIDRLWEHDGHSPSFTSDLKKAVYTKRVVDEIHMRLTESLHFPWYETDYTCITTEDGTTWETSSTLDINPSLKINAPPTKFHGPASKWEEIGQGGGQLVDPTPGVSTGTTTLAENKAAFNEQTLHGTVHTLPLEELPTYDEDAQKGKEMMDDPPMFNEEGEV